MREGVSAYKTGCTEPADWCEEKGGWELEIVERDKEAKGFKVLPKRWIVERTFGWLRRFEMALREEGLSDFVYDEQQDLFRFPDGRFAFSKE